MARSRRSELGALGALLLATSGCAFGEGDVWGEARVSLGARLEAGERLDAEGRWTTAESFALRLDTVAVSVVRLELDRASAGVPEGFDPASPPPGFSLCHNGHCHADDGRLVDYAEVAASARGGVATPSAALTIEARDGRVALGPTVTEVPLEPCPAGCVLDHGTLAEAAVALDMLVLRGRAFDLTSSARLPREGADFALELAIAARIRGDIDVPIDSSESVGAAIALELVLGPRALDGHDFVALTRPGTTSSSTAAVTATERLTEHARLEHRLERFDP